MGYTGHTGYTGFTGPTGPSGWSGRCLKSFIKVYNTVTQSVPLESAVTFNSIEGMYGPINFTIGDSRIRIGSVGSFLVIFKLYHLFAAQVALFINENIIPGSVSGEAAPAANLMGTSIVMVSSSDLLIDPDSITGVSAVLEIRNHSSYISPLTLDGREGAGSVLLQDNASVVVIQLCDGEIFMPL